MKALAANAELFRIDQFVADMHAFHQTDDQPIAADLERAPFRALQAGGRLGDARRLTRTRAKSLGQRFQSLAP